MYLICLKCLKIILELVFINIYIYILIFDDSVCLE